MGRCWKGPVPYGNRARQNDGGRLKIGPFPRCETRVMDELKPIKGDIAKIRRSQEAMINFFGNENIRLRSRMEQNESLLNISPLLES